VSELRTTAQRRADVLVTLERQGQGWLATASRDGIPRLIAVTATWTGTDVVIATRTPSPTAGNLDETRLARLALGTPDDAMMADLEVSEMAPATRQAGPLHDAFVGAAGWDPADEGPDWRYFRLRPTRIEAYRGYGELEGRAVMRDGAWLA